MTLLSRAWPGKTRHLHLSDVEASFPVVLHDRAHVLEDQVHDTRRDDDSNPIVEEDVVVARPVRWSRYLADGMQGPRDVGDFPLAGDLSVVALEYCVAGAVALNVLIGRADEMAPGLVRLDVDIAGEGAWSDNVVDSACVRGNLYPDLVRCGDEELVADDLAVFENSENAAMMSRLPLGRLLLIK